MCIRDSLVANSGSALIHSRTVMRFGKCESRQIEIIDSPLAMRSKISCRISALLAGGMDAPMPESLRRLPRGHVHRASVLAGSVNLLTDPRSTTKGRQLGALACRDFHRHADRRLCVR